MLLSQRFGMLMESMLHCLADHELFRLSAERSGGFYPAVFINNLVDSCTGAISAPVLPETHREIDRKS